MSLDDSPSESDYSKMLQDMYAKGELDKCLLALNACTTTKAVEHNRLIVQCRMNQSGEPLLSELISNEELSLNQQVLYDYNRALALSRYENRFDDAIEVLENRMLVLTEPFGVVDEKIAFKLFYLLAVIYIERKRNLQKALNLLQIINDKCDPFTCPPNLQYMKVRCYLAMGNIKKVKKKLKFLSQTEADLVRVYIEYQKNAPVKAFKMYNDLFKQAIGTDIGFFNNDLVLRSYGQPCLAALQYNVCSRPLTQEMYYNRALLNMFTDNFPLAISSYQTCLKFFHFNPNVWLRLAECYVKLWLREIGRYETRHQDSVYMIGMSGENMNRKVFLNCAKPELEVSNEKLVLARGCCLNALMLLAKDETLLSFYPSNTPSEPELKSFKVSVRLMLAYTCLRLQDFHLAHKYSHEVLTTLQPTSLQKVLAITYLCEALVRLQARKTSSKLNEICEQYREAMKLLVTDTKLILQEDELSVNRELKLINWHLERLQFVLRYNYAVVLSLQAKHTEADQEVQKIRIANASLFEDQEQFPRQLVLLEMYLAKKLGRKIAFNWNPIGLKPS